MDASRIAKEASRLQPLAERVLGRYPFTIREVQHLATHSNVMYRVTTRSGEQMVLRVGSPHGNTRSNIEFEVSWLDAISKDTYLDVVTPIRASGNVLVVDEHDPDLGKERPCVLFSWVPGAPLGSGSGTFGYRQLGQMLAALQAHGRSWRPERVSEMRHWDRIFYYGVETDPVIIEDPVYGHLFDDARRAVIAKASRIAESVVQEAWAEGKPQVVHGDLHEWNVHLVGSRIHAFDFEDVMIALPAQDVAISLYNSRTHDQRDDVWAAFRRGYETVAEWPVIDESQLDGFHAARQVMLMNYAARTLPVTEAGEYLDRVMPWLGSYARRYG